MNETPFSSSASPVLKRVGYGLSGLVLVAVALYLLVVWPRVNLPVNHGEYGEIKAIERFNMVNEKRRTAVQIVGGIIVVVTAFFTLRNVVAAEANAKVAREKHDQDRFFKATENLDNEKLSARLGAIYTLERMAWQSKDDFLVILQALTAFVCQAVPKSLLKPDHAFHLNERPNSDVQAVIFALGRLCSIPSGRPLIHLTDCYLSGVMLSDGSEHEGVYNFESVIFIGSCLFHAYAVDCNLKNVLFHDANLNAAVLKGSDCTDADFARCQLQETDFTDCILTKANFCGVDLRYSIGLTQEQINSALTDTETKLPPNLHLPNDLQEGG